MIKKIILISLSCLVFSSCIEFMTHYPDSEIVVIGNGADGEYLLVADVREEKESPIESLVIHKSEIVPVSVRFRPYTEEPEEEIPTRLEWVTRDFQGNQVMRRTILNEEENEYCSFVQTSSTESICRNDLESLLISDEHEPIFLADGRMVFIDAADDLILFEREHAFEILMSGVKRFFVGNDNLVFFETEEHHWFYMDRFISMGSVTEEPVDIAYLSDDKNLFVFIDSVEGDMMPSLYRFDEETRLLSDVWDKTTPKFNINKYRTDEFSVVRGDKMFTLGSVSCGLLCSKHGVISISPEGLDFIELDDEPKSLSVGLNYMTVQYDDGLLELCRNQKQPELIESSDESRTKNRHCESLENPEGYNVLKAVLGPKDQMYLSAEKLALEEEPVQEDLISDQLDEDDTDVVSEIQYEVLLLKMDDEQKWVLANSWSVEGDIEDIRLLTP